MLSACSQSGDERRFAELLAETRWTEPRLSLDRPARACLARVAEKLTDFCPKVVTTADSRLSLREFARSERSLDTHSRALFHLARGTAGGVPEALLERHIAANPSAAAWSDLSATILVSAEDGNDWRSFESAVVAADTALSQDHQYHRAHFNRALVLERLLLHEEAADGWIEYLRLTEDSPWSTEVEDRLRRIEASKPGILPPEFPSRLSLSDRESLEELARLHPSAIQRALDREPAFLKEIVDNVQSFCEHQRDAWRTLGELTSTLYADSLLQDSVDWICSPNLPSDDALAGLNLLVVAIEAYGRSELDRSLETATEATRRLKAARSPLFHLAMSIQASTLFAMSIYEPAMSLLETSFRETEKSYPLLAARAQRYLGSIEIRRERNAQAVEHFEKGAALLAQGGDPEQLVRLRSLSAEAFSRAGQYDEAWQHGLAALREARQRRLPSDSLSATCEFLAVVAAESGAPHLQKLYADCSIHHLAQDDEPAYITSAHIVRAQARTSLGDPVGAANDLERARAAAESVEDIAERENLIRHVDLFDGVNAAAQAHASSVEPLSRAWEYFGRRGNRVNEITAGVALVDAYSALGDHDKADLLLEELGGLAAEAQRAARSEDFVLPIQRHFRDVVNRRIRSRLGNRDELGGLLALTEARLARDLSRSDMRELIAGIQKRSDNEATLILAWLDGEVAGWLIDERGLVDWFLEPLPRGRVLVGRAAGTHSIPLADGRLGALASLYDALIAPIADKIGNADTLRIVPDDLLFGVPYAALWNTGAKRYLTEDFVLVLSPELVTSEERFEKNPTYRSVAIFADATADPDRPLASLNSETEAIRGLFQPISFLQLYSGDTATRDNFIDALGRYDLLHFGGHGEVDVRSPLESRLILSSLRSGAFMEITAAELYEQEIERMPRLIVLAACDTAAYTDRLPQALAMVRPLLRLGAGVVVGSLRPIPDEAYSRMMTLFYEALVQTGDPASALHAVQMEFKESDASGQPGYWAFIQIFRYL